MSDEPDNSAASQWTWSSTRLDIPPNIYDENGIKLEPTDKTELEKENDLLKVRIASLEKELKHLKEILE